MNRPPSNHATWCTPSSVSSATCIATRTPSSACAQTPRDHPRSTMPSARALPCQLPQLFPRNTALPVGRTVRSLPFLRTPTLRLPSQASTTKVDHPCSTQHALPSPSVITSTNDPSEQKRDWIVEPLTLLMATRTTTHAHRKHR
jgi:hypothetical protein